MKETLKIRHYIIGLLYESGKAAVPLMSVRKLAAHFGVAQCTVSAAVKELIDEGYVISRPGVGMFTNPNKLAFYGELRRPLLIGVIHGDGRYYYLDHSAWRSLSPVIGALVGRNYNVRQIFFESGDPEEVFNEITLTPLDGLVWIDNPNPDEALLRRLLKHNLPIIIDHDGFDFINVVGFDFLGMMKRLAHTLVAEGKQQLLWSMPPYETKSALEVVRQIFEAGRPAAKVTVIQDNVPEFEELLAKALAATPFDIVSAHRRCNDLIKKYYRDKPGQPECLDWHIFSTGEAAGQASGWFFSLAERGQKMAERMEQMLNGDRSIQKILLDMYIKREGDK